MRGCFAEAQKDALNLGGKDVDAPDDQHVVASTKDLAHANQGAAALAGFGMQHRKIAAD